MEERVHRARPIYCAVCIFFCQWRGNCTHYMTTSMVKPFIILQDTRTCIHMYMQYELICKSLHGYFCQYMYCAF